MNDMIKAEREKILSRKPAKILFAAGVILSLAYFFFFQFHHASVYYDYEAGRMKSVSGFAAIEQRRETAALFEGELTQDTLKLMGQKLEEAKSAAEGKDENSIFSAVYVYRDQAAILEHITNPDGSLKELKTAYPDSKRMTLGYCDGWDYLLSGMGSILAICMCLLIVIGLSPVFAEEYSLHTDSVLCAARYGRTKLAAAKVIASLETVIGVYAVYLGMYLLLYGCVYGLDGWDVSIQSSLHYASSVYPVNFLQMFFITAVWNLLGIIALSMLTLFLSANMGSPVSALITSCIVCFLPVIFDFTESLPALQKAQELCPIFLFHMNGIFAVRKTYGGIMQPLMMLIFNMGIGVVFYKLTKYTFRRHQAVG